MIAQSIPLPVTEACGRVIMRSVGAEIAAQAGRGNRTQAEDDYQIILPQLPTGGIVANTVFLHGDVKARPYRVEDFRDMLARTGMLSDVIALGGYQINHVWAVTFNTAEATKKMLDSGEQEVKGRRCLIFDPQNQQVRLKLHWLLQGVDDEDVRAAFAAFGRVTEVTKERWRVQGVHDKGSTTRTVMLKLKAGVKLALVVAPVPAHAVLALPRGGTCSKGVQSLPLLAVSAFRTHGRTMRSHLRQRDWAGRW